MVCAIVHADCNVSFSTVQTTPTIAVPPGNPFVLLTFSPEDHMQTVRRICTIYRRKIKYLSFKGFAARQRHSIPKRDYYCKRPILRIPKY
jgi:hypothetical protein